MAFMVQTFDKPEGATIRNAHRAAHYEYLESYRSILIASGGLQNDAGTQFIGSCILLNVETLEEVEKFVAADPFHQAGLAAKVVISRWKAAFVNGTRL